MTSWSSLESRVPALMGTCVGKGCVISFLHLVSRWRLTFKGEDNIFGQITLAGETTGIGRVWPLLLDPKANREKINVSIGLIPYGLCTVHHSRGLNLSRTLLAHIYQASVMSVRWGACTTRILKENMTHSHSLLTLLLYQQTTGQLLASGFESIWYLCFVLVSSTQQLKSLSSHTTLL